MKSAIGRRVVVLTTVMLGTFGLGQAGAGAHSTAPAAQAPGTQQATGRLMVAHGDDFSGHNMIMSAQVRTRTGVIPVHVSAAQHSEVMALAGRDVVVTGRPTSAGLSADSVRATGPAATPSTRRIAVVLLRYKNSTVQDITAAEANTLFFGATGSVKKWFNEVSGGAVTVTGQVFGWYPSNMATTDCTNGGEMLDAWLVEGAMRAAAGGYVASNFDNLVIHTPEFSGPGCGFSGIAWVGDNGVLLKGSVSNKVGVASHELGHNMGLWHAGSMDCHGVTIAASCSVIDYGDPYDVMGDAYDGHHYNGAHKYMLGWMAPSQVRTVSSGTQTIALTASEQPATGTTQLIILPRNATSSYAIERRASFGDFDQGLSGVWVRILTTINSDDTVLLDMKPLTPVVDDGSMTVGQTLNDTANHVSINLLSDGGPTASVKVCVGTCGNPPPPPPQPYWYLRNTNAPGSPSIPAFQFGAAGDIPVVGNWDGVGGDTIGVFRPSTRTWYLRNTNAPGSPSIPAFQFGAAGDIPVVGNWDGVGGDTIGVFRPSTRTWYLRNTNAPGSPSIPAFQFGAAGDIPVVGNWDGVGGDTIGVFRPSTRTWYLRNTNAPGSPSIPAFQFGAAGDLPVVGNWDGVGGDTIGVFRPSTRTWYLRNTNAPGSPSIPAFQFGGAGDLPVVGNWDGVGSGTIGVFRKP